MFTGDSSSYISMTFRYDIREKRKQKQYQQQKSITVYINTYLGEGHVSCKNLFPIFLCNLHNKICLNQSIGQFVELEGGILISLPQNAPRCGGISLTVLKVQLPWVPAVLWLFIYGSGSITLCGH